MTHTSETSTRRNFLRNMFLPAVAAAVLVTSGAMTNSSQAETKPVPPAYWAGYKKGKLIGRKHGYEDGYKSAYKASYIDELNNPTAMARHNGPNWYLVGYKKGYKVGYSVGWKQGQKAGKIDGREDAQAQREDLREDMRKCMEQGICS